MVHKFQQLLAYEHWVHMFEIHLGHECVSKFFLALYCCFWVEIVQQALSVESYQRLCNKIQVPGK